MSINFREEDLYYNEEQRYEKILCHMNKRASLTELIKELTQRWLNVYKFKNPKDINNGNCGDFAEDLLWLIYNEGEAVWHNDHCAAFINGRFYDSECHEGTKNINNLPFYERLKVFEEEIKSRDKWQ